MNKKLPAQIYSARAWYQPCISYLSEINGALNTYQLRVQTRGGGEPPTFERLLNHYPTITLKQIIFILATFCLCRCSFAQTDKCQIGIDSAQADYAKGILRTYIFGLENSFTFGKLLHEIYGIEVVYGGCIIRQEWDCYSEFMDTQIKAKFGDDIFDKVARKARQLDISGMGDRASEFPGGTMGLMKFVYCNLDLSKANYAQNREGKVYLQFTIDTTGIPTDIKILNSSNEDYTREAMRIIKLMPNWTVATKNGKAIPQEWNLPIVFDQTRKEKNCR